MKKVISVILCIILAISCQACGLSNNNDKVIVDDEKGLDIVKMIADGSAADLKRGQVVAFGKFEQDNNDSNGSESINWVVLNVNTDKKGVDCAPTVILLGMDPSALVNNILMLGERINNRN